MGRENLAMLHAMEVLEARCAPDPALREEFEKGIARHNPKVYAMCLRVTGDPQLAADLTQDTLLTAYRKLADYDGRSTLSTWMCGIAKNLSFNAIRRRRELLTEDGVLEETDPDGGALRKLSRDERERLVQQASTSCLDDLEQEAVYLRYVENLPVERIDEVLELDQASGARGLLQRCRRKLGRELRRRLDDLGHGSSFVRTVA